MESFGLPCTHIIAVMVHLDVDELPKSLVLDRWSKRAKKSIESKIVEEPMSGDSALYRTRVASFVHHCRRLAKVACLADEDYYEMWDKVTNETLQLEVKHGLVMQSWVEDQLSFEGVVKDPVAVRSKGRVIGSKAAKKKGKGVMGSCIGKRQRGTSRGGCSTSRCDAEYEFGDDMVSL